jgi:hypothetical protein
MLGWLVELALKVDSNNNKMPGIRSADSDNNLWEIIHNCYIDSKPKQPKKLLELLALKCL